MSASEGILLWAADPALQAEAARRKLPVELLDPAALPGLPFDRALVLAPGACVPWGLVADGFRFLDRWEAAAPLLERELAEDLGGGAERRRTAEVVRDLRVPVYACELLFVRDGDGGNGLLTAWIAEQGEQGGSYDAGWRLAFLRALYGVKPLFLALPRTWLKGEPAPGVAQRRLPRARGGLLQVEIAPGRYVCCQPDEVEKYKERFAKMRTGRR